MAGEDVRPVARAGGVDGLPPQWGTRVGLILSSVGCAFALGLAVLLDTILAPLGGPRLPAMWWGAFVLYVLSLLAVHGYLPQPRWFSIDARLILLAGLGVVLVMLFPSQGWLALLFVLTTTMAAFFWPARAIAALVVVQTALVVVMGLVGGWSTTDLAVSAVVFGISQVFGALVVFIVRSEAAARRELAVSHADQRAIAVQLEVTTREAERLRISRDLHDLTGHQLTALSLELEVAGHLAAEGAARDHVVRARTIAKDLLGTVRTAVGEMRSDSPSLEAALRELLAGIPSLDAVVEVDIADTLDIDRTLTILRCVQEAITNTLRHADARSVRVVVDEQAGGVRISISDDGDGASSYQPGHGLTGMRERFEVFGGRLETHSRPGAGFTVTGWLPCVVTEVEA